MFYFPSPNLSSLLQAPSQAPSLPILFQELLRFCTGSRFPHCIYTLWQFIGDLSAPTTGLWITHLFLATWNCSINVCGMNTEIILFCSLFFYVFFKALLRCHLLWAAFLDSLPFPAGVIHAFHVPTALGTNFHYSTYQISSYFIIGLPRATTLHTSREHHWYYLYLPTRQWPLQSKDPMTLLITCL